MLYVRPLNGNAAQPLAGTQDAAFPFWSPDSRSIAFFSGGKLRKLDASGGPVQVLADAPGGRGGSWSSQGMIVFAPLLSGPIFKVSDGGGAASAVTVVESRRGEVTHRWPSFLPDGHHFLFMSTRAAADRALLVGSIDGGLTKSVLSLNSNAVYTRDGYVLYLLDGSLVAQAFDVKTLAVTGNAMPIAESVGYTGKGVAFFNVSNNGVLGYPAGRGRELSQLQWFDENGKSLGTVGKQGDYQGLSVSHDGRRIAVTVTDP